MRTCDAVGACLAVPRLPWVREALARGNTMRRPACMHWAGRDARGWQRDQRSAGYRIIGVELADEAIRLADLRAARQRTDAVLGHEQKGIPAEALDPLDAAVEIPMVGTGASLNVPVAGSPILYRLAGFIGGHEQGPRSRRGTGTSSRRRNGIGSARTAAIQDVRGEARHALR